MSAPAVTIKFDEPRWVYQPGETLSGHCRWDAADGDKVKRVEVSVLWRSEGKGDEDFGVHEFVRSSSAQRRDDKIILRFEGCLPNSPLSYDGAIVKICWCVRARVILQGDKDQVVEKPFRLGNVPKARALASPFETRTRKEE